MLLSSAQSYVLRGNSIHHSTSLAHLHINRSLIASSIKGLSRAHVNHLRLAGTTRATQPRRLRSAAATRAAAAPPATVPVRFRIHRGVKYGQNHTIVGDNPAFGNWDVSRGAQMTWSDGDNWSIEVHLPPGTCISFKCVQVSKDGSTVWEDGDNHIITVPENPEGLSIELTWSKGIKTDNPAAVDDHRQRSTTADASNSNNNESHNQENNDNNSNNNGSSIMSSSSSFEDEFSPMQRWEGRGPVFMRSNEHSTDRQGIWETSGLSGASLVLVEGDRDSGSWLGKLGVAKNVLVDTAHAMRPDTEALAHAFVYLTWVATGALPCVESGGHRRPNHHAELSRLTFRSLEWVIGERAGTMDAVLARRMHTKLPSFTEAFTQSTPLTRIRDIAHRNDIPQWLKQEIKHTIQNKLHRNAGPEDLVATEALLARIESAPSGEFPEAFIHELRLFSSELRDFFNAGSLGDALHGILPGLDEANIRLIERFLAAKSVLDNAGMQADDNVIMDALHGATSVRALLGSGLSSGLRNDAPDRAMSMRQRWRLAEIRAEDYVFVLLSRFINSLENRGGAATLATGTDGTWALPIGALVIGLRHLGLCGFRTAECMSLEHELSAWQRLGGFIHKDEALRLRATLQRLRRLAEDYSQGLLDTLSEPAATLGNAFGLEAERCSVFAESEIRSNVVFQISKLTSMMLDATTTVAGVSPWDVIVSGDATGVLIEVAALEPGCLDAAGDGNDAIVLVESATGDEEVSALGSRLKGVILKQQLPHLSHLGVRARQEKVPFVVCEDAAMVNNTLKKFVGKKMELKARPDNVEFELASTTTASASASTSTSASSTTTTTKASTTTNNNDNDNGGEAFSAVAAAALQTPQKITKVDTVSFVPLEDATPETCGAKAAGCGHLLVLAAECAGAVQTSGRSDGAPLFEASNGVCLPFGCMEAAVKADGKSKKLDEALKRAETAAAASQGSVNTSTASPVTAASLDALCEEVHDIISTTKVPQTVLHTLAGAFDPGCTVIVRSSANVEDLAGMSGAGLYESIPNIDPRDPIALQTAITQVWASLHSRRALLARAAAHVPHGGADMAVVVQRQLAPDVSFVLHTAHPQTHDQGVLVAEIAPGMGETLASGAQGSGWRLEVEKATGAVKTAAFANFSEAFLPVVGRINVGNGNGLVKLRTVDYSQQELSWSEDARTALGRRLAAAGRLLEVEFGAAQDVEGCVVEGRVFIVQTRPQP